MIGIIGGSKVRLPDNFKIVSKKVIRTPFGIPSAPVIFAKAGQEDVIFLARHGLQHTIAPHNINYRANIWALHHIGCHSVMAFSAMFSVNDRYQEGDTVIPHQLIDYTWSRQATFFDTKMGHVQYTEFLNPYSESLRQVLNSAAKNVSNSHHDQAIYGITQGPRYETHAEINRYIQDGCQVMGMTGMPEASLAQEIQLKFAICGIVTNVYNKEKTTNEATRDTTSRNLADNDEMIEKIIFEALRIVG